MHEHANLYIFLSVYFTSLFLDAQTEVPAMKLRTPTCSSPTCPRPWMRNSWRACSLRMEKSSVRRSSSIIKLVSPKGAVSFSSQKPPRLIGLYPVSDLISSFIRAFFQNSSRMIISGLVLLYSRCCTVLVLLLITWCQNWTEVWRRALPTSWPWKRLKTASRPKLWSMDKFKSFITTHHIRGPVSWPIWGFH